MKFIRRLFYLLVTLFGLWAIGLLWFVSQIPREPTENTRFTDAIVVLTGGSLRLENGLKLIAEGKARKIFISGVGRGVKVKELLAEAEKNSGLTKEKLGSSIIELGREAFDTKTNAQETAEWLRRQDYHSIRLVTANYHTPRSIMEFRRLMPDLEIIPDPVFPDRFKGEEWWRFRGTLRLIFSEYHKYLASELHYLLVTTGVIQNTI